MASLAKPDQTVGDACDGQIRGSRTPDGRKTFFEQIARQLATEFPERFRSCEQALSYAEAISQEYSR